MTEQDHILIERYLDKEMSEEERIQFESRLAQEESLRSALNTMQSAQHFLQYEALEKEKSAISAGAESYHKEQMVKRALLLGALLLIISVTLIYLMKQNRTTEISTNKLDSNAIQTKLPVLSDNTENHLNNSKELNKTTQVPVETKKNTGIDPNEINGTNAKEVVLNSDSEIPKKETPNEKTVSSTTIVCNYSIILETEEISTCIEKSDGSIRIKNAKGGNPPYLYRINEGSFSDVDQFRYLKAGTYTVHVSDRYNCGSEISVQVPEKECPKEISGIISYSQNTEWKFPVDIEDGNFTVVNGAGEIVWKSIIHAGQPASWSGLDERQQNLPAGAYYYKLFDGEVIKALGSITIVQ